MTDHGLSNMGSSHPKQHIPKGKSLHEALWAKNEGNHTPIRSVTESVDNCEEGPGVAQNLVFRFNHSALLILKANDQLLWNSNNKFLKMLPWGRVLWRSCICIKYPTYSSRPLSKILPLWRDLWSRDKIISSCFGRFVWMAISFNNGVWFDALRKCCSCLAQS